MNDPKQTTNLALWTPADGAARIALAPAVPRFPNLALETAGAPLWMSLYAGAMGWKMLGHYPQNINVVYAFHDDLTYSALPSGTLLLLPHSGLALSNSNGGSVGTTAPVFQSEIGLLRGTTSGNAAGTAGLSMRFGVNAGVICSDQSFAYVDVRVKLTQLWTSAQRFTFFVGMDIDSNNRFGMLYDGSQSDNWLAVNVNAGVSAGSVIDTGQAVVAGLQTRVSTWKLPGELGSHFALGGAEVVGPGPLTTNFPTARIALNTTIVSSLGGTAKTADWDWVAGIFDYGGGREPSE